MQTQCLAHHANGSWSTVLSRVFSNRFCYRILCRRLYRTPVALVVSLDMFLHLGQYPISIHCVASYRRQDILQPPTRSPNLPQYTINTGREHWRLRKALGLLVTVSRISCPISTTKQVQSDMTTPHYKRAARSASLEYLRPSRSLYFFRPGDSSVPIELPSLSLFSPTRVITSLPNCRS